MTKKKNICLMIIILIFLSIPITSNIQAKLTSTEKIEEDVKERIVFSKCNNGMCSVYLAKIIYHLLGAMISTILFTAYLPTLIFPPIGVPLELAFFIRMVSHSVITGDNLVNYVSNSCPFAESFRGVITIILNKINEIIDVIKTIIEFISDLIPSDSDTYLQEIYPDYLNVSCSLCENAR